MFLDQVRRQAQRGIIAQWAPCSGAGQTDTGHVRLAHHYQLTFDEDRDAGRIDRTHHDNGQYHAVQDRCTCSEEQCVTAQNKPQHGQPGPRIRPREAVWKYPSEAPLALH